MSSSIRLTTSGAPETPPLGYARIYLDDYNGKLHLKMIRPDGSIEVFGTLNLPLGIEHGGTGVLDTPDIGQFLIGTGDGYRVGDIIAGAGVNITKTATSFEISTDISNIELQMPTEFSVAEASISGQNTFVVTKTDQFANTIFAGPYSEDGAPTFRFLQVNDIPDLPISKIINLVDTIRSESLLIPVDSDDIDHAYDTTAKTLISTLKPTSVIPGSYGSATESISLNVRNDGRLDSVSYLPIAIPHTQITDFTEATQDVIGTLASNSSSINAEYDDYANALKFYVNEEHLITTNISDTENQRAPTSQAIKLYVDENLATERNSRINQDSLLQQAITSLENQVGTDLQEQLNNIQQQLADYALEDAANLQQAIADLETRINQGVVIPKTDTITVSQVDIDNGYVTLTSNKIIANSISATLNRVVLLENIDFTITSLPNNTSRLTFMESDLVDLSDVLRFNYLYTDSLDCSISANYDNFVITSEDIQNGYLLLSNTNLMPESITAFVDRVPLLQGFDFVVTKLISNIYKLTFIGDILQNQPLALTPGENIRVNYLCRS